MKKKKHASDTLVKQEKKEHEIRAARLELVAGQIGLPADMVAGVPVIHFVGTREVRIENQKGILKFSDTKIVIGANPYAVTVTGKRLEIAYLTKEEVKIVGMITGVAYRNDESGGSKERSEG